MLLVSLLFFILYAVVGLVCEMLVCFVGWCCNLLQVFSSVLGLGLASWCTFHACRDRVVGQYRSLIVSTPSIRQGVPSIGDRVLGGLLGMLIYEKPDATVLEDGDLLDTVCTVNKNPSRVWCRCDPMQWNLTKISTVSKQVSKQMWSNANKVGIQAMCLQRRRPALQLAGSGQCVCEDGMAI